MVAMYFSSERTSTVLEDSQAFYYQSSKKRNVVGEDSVSLLAVEYDREDNYAMLALYRTVER